MKQSGTPDKDSKRPYWLTKWLLTSALVATPVTAPSGLFAEGLLASFTVSQRLEYTNEEGVTTRDDEGFISRTSLGFSLSSETRNQSFSLTANTSLKYNLSNSRGNDRFELDDPTLRLGYTIENRNTELSFNGSYQRTDVDNTPFVDEITGEDIITGDGLRENYGLTTSLILGREAPTRLSLTHRYQKINYSGTTAASLVDTEIHGLNGRLTFRLSEVAEAYVFASWDERNALGVGSNDRTTESVGIGGSYEVSPVLRFTAELSHQKIETDDNAGTVTTTDGINYRLGMTRDLPTGNISVNFNESETVNGKRRQLTFGRFYEHKRGEIDLSIGVTKTDGLKAAPLVNISADWELGEETSLALSLGQSSVVNNNNETTINSRLGLTYSQTFSERASLSAGVNMTKRDVRSAGGQDQTSIRLNVSHRYQVGGEWDLVSGYTYSKTKRDTQPDRKSSTLFVGLQKTFERRP